MTCGMPSMSRTWKCQIFLSTWKTTCSFSWYFYCLKFFGDWLISQFVCLSTPADCTDTSDVEPQKFFHLQKSGGKKVQKKEKLYLKNKTITHVRENKTNITSHRGVYSAEMTSQSAWWGQSLNGIVLNTQRAVDGGWRWLTTFLSLFSPAKIIFFSHQLLCVLYGLESEEFPGSGSIRTIW